MSGHGRPTASFLGRAPTSCRRWLAALLVALALAETASSAPVRVRVAWGGGAPRVWQGEIRVQGGQLAEPRPLGIEADAPGSMWLDAERLMIRQRSPRTYDGVDLVVDAPRDGMLVIELRTADEPAAKTIEVPLASIMSGFHSVGLDTGGNRLLVRRTPDDMLRVTVKHRALVFAPGETFRFELAPHLLPADAGTRLAIRMELVAARSAEVLWSAEHPLVSGESVVISQEIGLPRSEGVYDVRITAVHAGMLRLAQPVGALGWAKQPIAERKIQLVVLAAEPVETPVATASDSKAVVEIDPANPRWWERFATRPQWRLGSRLGKGPLGSGQITTRQHALGAVVELGPAAPGGEVSWEAYTLPIDEPGLPHLLEIDYPSDVPQTMGISVVEPNEAGAVYPLGLDSGVDLAEEITGPEGPARWLRHRLIFWPRTRAPVVLVTNRRDGMPAVYGKIRVAVLGRHLPRAFPAAQGAARLWAGYMDRPLVPENFSASEAIGAMSDLGVDDWMTFYEGGSRLVEYLNHVGMNGLVLSVMADGSTIYPSAIEPTPRYDTGTFLEQAGDPLRKDVLELLLRMFARERLALVPALDFGAPLPELEAMLRRGGAEAEGLQWIGARGKPWESVYAPRRGTAAYYNVLHPRVQEAMLAVVREVATRYAQHPAFAGLALQLNAYGYAQLPGPEWGLDDATIGRFQADTGIMVPGAGAERFLERANFLSAQHPREWLAWRSERLAEFYRRVEAELKTARPQARLYLAGANLFAGEELQRQLQPALPQRITLGETLLRVGIDARFYAAADGPLLLRPERIAPRWSLARQAVNLELRQMPDAERCFQAAGAAGALFFHQPQEIRVAGFDAKAPFKSSYTWLATQPVPAGRQNRRRFVRALATSDPHVIIDGGWQLSLGGEDSLADLIAAYRRLPGVPFMRLEDPPDGASSQPITVRYAVDGGQTYIYLVNDAPFATKVQLPLQAPADCRIEELSGMRRLAPLERGAEGTSLRAALDAYDFLALRLSSPMVRLASPKVEWSAEVETVLARRIAELGDRAAVLRGQPPVYDVLENASFERQPGGAAIAGWASASQPGTSVRLDPQEKHGGETSLALKSEGAVATVVSAPFEPPPTGRLSVGLWMKTADAAQQPPLRIAVAGSCDGRELFRYRHVGQPGANQPAPLDTDWQKLIIEVNDLPLEGLSPLELRFDLLGPGEVWIDDVELYHLDFQKEWGRLMVLIAPATHKLGRREVGDCVRLLESYWPQFLAAYVPLPQNVASRGASAPTQRAPPPSPARAPQQTTSLVDRLRGWLPERLR